MIIEKIPPLVLTVERSVPLQPIQVVRCDQSGYAVPEGMAGLLCTEDYKYCGLALQVGG